MQLQPHFENNKQDNFAFLKDGLEELYNQAVFAERYYFTDRQSSMAKIRLFVELACHELCKHFDICLPIQGELANKIKTLQCSQRVDEWVIDEMNNLRLDGNRSVHITEVNRAYIAKLSISRCHMQKNMNSLYEIAHYVGQIILKTESQCTYKWQEPVSCELSEFVTCALKGSKEASYYLANKFYIELLEMSKQTGTERWWHKDQYIDKQADLLYWLEKAHSRGHDQTWLLFAKCYSNKLLQEDRVRNAKYCFKKALKDDTQGEVAFEFGSHLIRGEEIALGESYIKQAAEQGYHMALAFQLNSAFTKGQDQQYWLERAKEYVLPEAFTVDAWMKLEEYETNKTDEALKALRSSLVAGKARRAPGVEFFKAYTDLTIYATSDVQEAITTMKSGYKCMPEYLDVEFRLFKQISNDDEHYDLMTDIYHAALKQSTTDLDVAEVKYSIVRQALSKAREKFKMRESVKTPKPIPVLLKEAADAGLPEARTFVNSTQGKAVLKQVGFSCQGRMQKNSSEKEKQKRKRKLAKKAKRK